MNIIGIDQMNDNAAENVDSKVRITIQICSLKLLFVCFIDKKVLLD